MPVVNKKNAMFKFPTYISHSGRRIIDRVHATIVPHTLTQTLSFCTNYVLFPVEMSKRPSVCISLNKDEASLMNEPGK